MGRPVARVTPMAVKAEQQKQCYEGFLAGKSYSVLSKELGISEGLIAKRIKEAANARVVPLVDRYREVENDRLDMLLRALSDGISEGDVSSINAAVKISERRAKLLGLDSPERIDVALSRAREDAANLLADALSAAVSAVLDAVRPDPRWVAELRRYGEETARWALLGRQGERPAAPAPPPEPEPSQAGVVEPAAILPGRSSDAALRSALSAFEAEFGPLGES